MRGGGNCGGTKGLVKLIFYSKKLKRNISRVCFN